MQTAVHLATLHWHYFTCRIDTHIFILLLNTEKHSLIFLCCQRLLHRVRLSKFWYEGDFQI